MSSMCQAAFLALKTFPLASQRYFARNTEAPVIVLLYFDSREFIEV